MYHDIHDVRIVDELHWPFTNWDVQFFCGGGCTSTEPERTRDPLSHVDWGG